MPVSCVFLMIPVRRESYKHTPIVHFAAEGKILLFGKSGFGKERVCADIVDVQELTSQGPRGGDSPWMEYFFEVPSETLGRQLHGELIRNSPYVPSTNPRDSYDNTSGYLLQAKAIQGFPRQCLTCPLLRRLDVCQTGVSATSLTTCLA